MIIKKHCFEYYLTFFLSVLFFTIAISSSALGYDINKVLANEYIVIVNGNYVEFDVSPYLESDRVLVPIRPIAEALEMNIDWNQALRKVTISNNDISVVLIIDNKEAIINNTVVQMDVPARIVNGRTMLPLRFVGESLNKNVYYDGAFLFGGDRGKKKTIWVLEYNLLEDEDFDKVELEKSYYLADRHEYAAENPYLLKEGIATRRDIKLGDSVSTIKDKYGVPAYEMLEDDKLIIRYGSKFIPETGGWPQMIFSFEEDKLIELILYL